MLCRHAKRALLLLLAASAAHAQTVDSLIAEAFRNNTQFTSFAYQIQGAGLRARAAGALPAPVLGLEFSQIPAGSGNVVSDALSQNLSLSQMFMLGGKLSAMADVEEKKGRVLEQERASFAVQLRGRIRMEYARLWLTERQIEVQQRILSLLRDLARLTAPRVQTNRLSQADLLTIEAEVSSEEAKLFELHATRASARSTLAALLGRDGGSADIVTEVALPGIGTAMPESALVQVLKQENPALRAMDRMSEMNDSEIRAAGRNLVPDLMVQAMVMRMPNGMVLTSGSRSVGALQAAVGGMPMNKAEWMYSVMVSLTLPFAPWSAERASGKADEMRAVNAGLEAERSAKQREMAASLSAAVNRYAATDSLARRYSESVLPLLREAAEAQTAAYNAGQAPISAVLNARRMELMRQNDYLMALAEGQTAFAEMEMMVGKPLR